MRNIHQRYVRETYDDQGLLETFSVECPPDFNFGYEALRGYIDAMEAECLCANLVDLGGELRIRPWALRRLENGLRVGITGVVTDFVNVWEQPQNLEKLRITDAFEAAKLALEQLAPLCDLSVCIYHGGFEEVLDTGRVLSDSGENIACRIARELDYDLLCSTCKYDKLYRCEFDVVGEVTYGSSEGIYGDIFLYGNWSKERDDPFKSRARVYVLKTLKQDKESYLAVGMLVNLICYYANEFVATHLDRFD